MFKRLDIVTIQGLGTRRWSVDRIRDVYDRDDEAYQMADLSDENGATTSARVDQLTKVAG